MFSHVGSVLQLVMLMVVTVHVLLGLPRRGSIWLFSMAEYIIEICVQNICGSSTPPYFQKVFGHFPRDIRAATAVFNLEPESTVYATCPTCHEIYQAKRVDGVPTYPERCNSRIFGSRCGQVLLRPKKSLRAHDICSDTPICILRFQGLVFESFISYRVRGRDG